MGKDLEEDEFEVLNYLDIYKTVSDREEIADSTRLDSEMIEIILMNLKDKEYLKDSWEITSTGEKAAKEYRERLLEESERKSELIELCDDFEEVNTRFKSFVTDYQEKKSQTLPGEENPPIEMDEFADIHEETINILEDLSEVLSFLNVYIEKFNHAFNQLEEGKSEYLVKKSSSYHDVWFEVHETLLNFLERERVE